MIIGLTGTNASGKGTVADLLAKKGFKIHSLSDLLREELLKLGLYPTREVLIRHGNRLRREGGEGVLAEKVLVRLEGRDVVDSIRNPGEIDVLRRLPAFTLIAVDAPVDLRFARSVRRGRKGDGLSLEEFKEKEEREKSDDKSAQQIHRCIESADYKLWNDGSIEELEEELEKVLAALETLEKERPPE